MALKPVKRIVTALISAISCVVVLFLTLAAATGIAAIIQISKNIEFQDEHLEYLEKEYYTDSYIPCDEQKHADFDIKQAFEQDVRINEVAVIGTHNSYQTLATAPKRALVKAINMITFGKVQNKSGFEMETFTEQFEHGVRSLEIDIITVDKGGDVSFIVTHQPMLDNASSAYDFEKALKEIALWSDNNPNHIPIYLLIEPKGEVGSYNDMKNFSAQYALEFDKVLRQQLGDRLLTPAQAMGEFENFAQMRKADSWPTLKQAAGKIIVLLHPCGITQDYIDTDPTIRTQAMFPALRFDSIDKEYTSFILENDPETACKNNKETVDEYKIMVRTRADDFLVFSDERYSFTDECGSHIISTDFPARNIRPDDHTYSFNGYTIKLLTD